MADKELTLRDLWRVFRARFSEDRCTETAASLTFMTLLAIVPTITLAFTIASVIPGLPAVLEQLREFLLLNILPESINVVSVYFESFLKNTTRLTALGVALIGTSGFFLVLTIDRAFNHIWHITRQRPLIRRVLMYVMVLTAGPLLVAISVSLSSYLLALTFSNVSEVSSLRNAALWFVPLALTTAALSLLYVGVPNCVVRKRDALVGAIVAGALLEVMKHAFGLYVGGFPTYGLLYGAFATLPIFFIWIYVSWLVIIVGAVLVAALPEWRAEMEAPRNVRDNDFFSALQVLQILWRQRGKVASYMELHSVSALPLERLDTILKILASAGWITANGTTDWVLSADLKVLNAADVYQLVIFDVDGLPLASSTASELERIAREVSSRIVISLQLPLAVLFDQAMSAQPGDGSTNGDPADLT